MPSFLFHSYWFWGLFALLALPYAAEIFRKYVLVSLKSRRQQVKPFVPPHQVLDLARLPPEMREQFAAAERQLAPLGFGVLAHLGMLDGRANVDSRVSVWTNAATGDVAQVIAVRVLRTGKVNFLVTYRQEYANDESVVTSNSSTPTVFPRDPASESITVPGLADVALLHQVHRARLAKRSRGRRPVVPSPGTGVAYLAEEWKRTFERLVREGYYTRDDAARVYRKTIKGAYLMTWRLLWPLKQLRAAARRREADRELRELGFGGIDEIYRHQYTTTAREQTSAPAPSRV